MFVVHHANITTAIFKQRLLLMAQDNMRQISVQGKFFVLYRLNSLSSACCNKFKKKKVIYFQCIYTLQIHYSLQTMYVKYLLLILLELFCIMARTSELSRLRWRSRGNRKREKRPFSRPWSRRKSAELPKRGNVCTRSTWERLCSRDKKRYESQWVSSDGVTAKQRFTKYRAKSNVFYWGRKALLGSILVPFLISLLNYASQKRLGDHSNAVTLNY